MILPLSSILLGAAGAAEVPAADPGYPVGVIPAAVPLINTLLAILPSVLLALGSLFLALFRWSTVKKIAAVLWRKKIGVSITTGVVVGAIYGLRAIWPETGPSAGAAEASIHPWPMFRGGPERRGAVPKSPDPLQGRINWGFTSECKMFYSSPCVVGNRVYVASTDYGPLRNQGGIYCLDADNGAIVWKSRPRGYLATFSSPSVAGKYLVVGEGLHFTTNARIVCLDVEHNGKVLWTYETKSHVESSPCIDLQRGRVYIGAGDDGYYCLALEPGGDGQAKVLWHLPGETFPDSETCPVVHDGKVYVGLGMGGKAVCCVDAETQEELWRIPTPYPVFAPPTVAAGKLFVGMGNGNFIETAEDVRRTEIQKMKDAGSSSAEIAEAEKRLGPAGEVWCIDLATHQVQWRFKADRVILGAIAADKERLYFASRGGRVYAVSMAGEALAPPWDARAVILASPALGEKHLYVVSQAGTLFALDAASLEPVWEMQLSLRGQFVSSPTVARGRVYVGTEIDGLLCVGEPRGDVDPIWPGRLGGAGRSGWLDGSPVPEYGSFAWRTPQDLDRDTAPVKRPVMALADSVYVALETAARTGLARIDLVEAPGKKVLPGEEEWFCPSQMPVHDLAALADSVYFVEGEPGRSGRTLRCLVAGRLWRGEADYLQARLTSIGQDLGLEADARAIIKKLQDGDALALEGGAATLDLGRANAILSKSAGSAEPVRLQKLGFAPEPKGGTERWRLPVADGAGGRLLITQGELFVVDRAEGLSLVEVRGEGAGRVRWSVPAGACVGAPAEAEETLVLAVSEGRTGALVALEAATGRERWRAPLLAAPTTGPVYAQGIICVGSPEGVTAHSIAGGVTLWHAPVGAVEGDLVCDGERLACTVAPDSLVLIDWVSGREMVRVDGVLRGVPPVLARDAMLFCRDRAGAASIERYVYGQEPGEAKRWLLTSWMGRITAPIVVSKSLAFVPTEKRGLVCVRPR